MTIEIWSINHKDGNISLCLCGMMPLRNHFCKKSVPRGQHPPINSLHVRPWIRDVATGGGGGGGKFAKCIDRKSGKLGPPEIT